MRLTDSQLAVVMAAARQLPVEKRDDYLQRLGARLRLQSGRPSDHDIEQAVQHVLRGLLQQHESVA